MLVMSIYHKTFYGILKLQLWSLVIHKTPEDDRITLCIDSAPMLYSRIAMRRLNSLRITKFYAPKYNTATSGIKFQENYSTFKLNLSYKRIVVTICEILCFVRAPCFPPQIQAVKKSILIMKTLTTFVDEISVFQSKHYGLYKATCIVLN